jgi:transposase
VLSTLCPSEPPGSTTAEAGATPTAPELSPSAPPMAFRRAITVLDTIPGVHQQGAELLVAEWGIAMEHFGTAPRLAAWSGVAPGNNESAGIQRSGKTCKGHRALRTALVQMANAEAHTKDTSLSALYHRLAARRGKKRAIVAVAHAIVRSAFHMLSRNEPYHELRRNDFDEHRREHLVERLTRRIERLGYHVALEPVVTS